MAKLTPYVRIPIREDEHKRLVALQTELTGRIDSYLTRPSLSDVIEYLLDQLRSAQYAYDHDYDHRDT